MKHRNWWIAWSVISPLSLILGMALSLIPTIAFMFLFKFKIAIEPEALFKTMIQESIMGGLIGLCMGAVLGFAQERLLRNHLPRLNRRWQFATVIPWCLEFALSPWFDTLRQNQSFYSTIAQSLNGMPMARYFPVLVLGLWSSGMQAIVLRRYLAHAERWLFMGFGWYALALLVSTVISDFTATAIVAFAIANSISGWFLQKNWASR